MHASLWTERGGGRMAVVSCVVVDGVLCLVKAVTANNIPPDLAAGLTEPDHPLLAAAGATSLRAWARGASLVCGGDCSSVASL